jgi:hypothetical protein
MCSLSIHNKRGPTNRVIVAQWNNLGFGGRLTGIMPYLLAFVGIRKLP